jgi:colicin import membrane protein
MARRLKVFRTHLGFYDMIVAAPSQKAAARAWGANPNLFAQGFAEVTADPQLVKAALAKPGIVLRRQFGSSGEFSENASLLRPPKPGSKEPVARRKREQHTAVDAERAVRQVAREQARKGAVAERAEQRSAAERQRKEAAANREEQRAARARDKAEAARRRDEERDAARARRNLQAQLRMLLRQRKDRLLEIETREKALATERRKVEQAFETRILALQRELEEA